MNHEWTRMDTNVVARVIQNHETHDTKIEQGVIEPRMDTNGHEWTRMDTNVVASVAQNHETHDTKIEQRVIEPRKDTKGHEWTRMSWPGWFYYLPSWGTVRHLELSCHLSNGGVLSRRGSMPATILSPLPQCQLAESVLCFVVADSQIRNGGLNSNTERIEESPLCASLNVSGK